MLLAIDGTPMAATIASTSSVTASSMRVKPRFDRTSARLLQVPGRDVGGLALAARLAVRAVAPEIVLPVIARAALVLVRVAPGIGRDRVLLEVRTVPVGDVRVPNERVETDRPRRVAPDVQAVLIQSGSEQLDLRAGGHGLRLADAAEEPRADQPGQEAQDDDDDDHLDEGEPAAVSPDSREEAGSGHRATSVREKMAISSATTMKPTMSPMTRMMAGSSKPMRRLTRRRTSDSKSAATLISMSSSRPVSSPTRTM